MRPRGEIRAALLDAARQSPGTSRDFAHRAQVGLHAAYYTTSRMVDAGELVILRPGKPALLAAPSSSSSAALVVQPAAPPSAMESLDALHRSWWEAPLMT